MKTQPISHSFFHAGGHTLAVWLGMAGAILNARGTILLIDPLISTIDQDGKISEEGSYPLRVPLPVEAKDVPRADAVLYTHADNDHFGRLTARILAEQTGCRFIAPPPVEQALREMGVPAQRILPAKEGGRHRLGEAVVQVTPAAHGWQEVDPWRREDCCGFLIKTPDGTVWHPGDTVWIDDLEAYKDVDVLFFDVAAVPYHLGPQGSARLAKSCGAKVMIAYHYGTFDLPPGSFANCDPDDALPYLKDLPGEYLKLNPGETLKLPV